MSNTSVQKNDSKAPYVSKSKLKRQKMNKILVITMLIVMLIPILANVLYMLG